MKSKYSQANTMCTVIIKAFKQLSAVKHPANITNLHHPNGINVLAIKAMITSPSEMSKLAHTYASIMPDWMTDHFVSPDMELHLQRIKTHEYCESNSARHMRKMDDVHLVDFVELELKGKEPFGIAYDVALASGLKSYLKKFVVLQPGDWPAQFYCRQLVYENTYMYRKKSQPIPNDRNIEESEENHNLNRVDDHTYMYSHNVRSEQTASNYSICQPLSPLASVVPMIGPLHVSLNSKGT